MKIIKLSTPEEIGMQLAKNLYQKIQVKPDLVIGLATGSTPLPLYAAFIKLLKEKPLDLSHITTFNLDEYYPMSSSNPNSYYFFMNKFLFSPLKLKRTQVNLPDGQSKNYRLECLKYENKINSCGGIDWQLLGVGVNGHIGFNEPGSKFNSLTRRVMLTQSTINANRRFFKSGEGVPIYALTMGLGVISRTKEIHLIATGENKATVVQRLLTEDPSTNLPASIIKKHPNATVWLDVQAAHTKV